MKNKKIFSVGINIKPNSIRIILIEGNKTDKCVIDQEEYSYSEEYTSLLQTIKTKLPKKTQYNLIIPHRSTIIKILQPIEYLTDHDILSLLQHNSERYFMLPFNEIYFDFEFLAIKNNCLRVAAVKKTEIQQYISNFRKAGIILNKINIDVLVFEKILKYIFSFNEGLQAIFLFDESEILQVLYHEGIVSHYSSSVFSDLTKEKFTQNINRFLQEAPTNFSQPKKIDTLTLLGDHPCHVLCKKLSNHFLFKLYCMPELETNMLKIKNMKYLLNYGTVL